MFEDSNIRAPLCVHPLAQVIHNYLCEAETGEGTPWWWALVLGPRGVDLNVSVIA